MKIGIVIEDISLLGGVEKVTLNLATMFEKNGHFVKIITLQNKYNLIKENIISIVSSKDSFKEIDSKYNFDYYVIEIIHLRYTINILNSMISINKKKIGVIHNTPYMYLKNYISLRDVFIFPKLLINVFWTVFVKKFVNYFLLRKIVSVMEIVSISKGASIELQRLFPRYKNKIHLIYNPVIIPDDSSFFGKHEKKMISFLGRFDFQKDLFLLLSVWKFFSLYRLDYVLNLVGDGPLKGSVMKMAKKKHLCNIVFNHCTENVSQVYEQSKIIILTSKYEGYPTVFSEALMNGCYIFSCKSDGGTNELINDDVGCYVSSRNAKKIAKELKVFISKIQASNSRFDKSKFINQNSDVYERWMRIFLHE